MSLSDYESVKDPDEEMERLAQSFLPLKHWGFTESFRSKEKLIFDSQLCRVSFVWSGWDMDSGYNLSRYYGRLHAPNNSEKMNWNGEECYCWHSLMGTSSVSDFLDGLTPQESANSKDFPKLIQQFRQSDLWHNLSGKRRNPELGMRMEAVIWDHYGLRLFELFDLHRPDLWEEYRKWLRTRYIAKGKSEEKERQLGIFIPSYLVC